MRRPLRSALRLGLVIAALAAVPAIADPLSPEDTLKQYLSAVQDGKFDRAYDLVSQGMKHGKSKDVWVKEQQYIMNFAEAKIFDFKVFPAEVQGDKAIVPNILSSQDKFLNQLALEENELYTLVKEDGVWKVDQQRIAEGAEVAKYFGKGAPQKQQAAKDAPKKP